MANVFFQFKHFRIIQDKCAMKVGTDGVLLGAWAPVEGVQSILDVGSGTGLLGLMLAQRAPEAAITAVEIDQDACLQSLENMQQSPWANRMEVVLGDFRRFARVDNRRYDLIVSNPPYFVGAQPSSIEARNVARHTTQLSYMELIRGVLQLLNPQGRFSLILPAENYQLFSNQALTAGLFEIRRMMVYPTPQKPVSRILSVWDQQGTHCCEKDKMVLEVKGRHDYSAEYLSLTRDFYLKA
jgi:tRNA1Val (adenine37-N6)-methyltransferase